MCIRDRPIPALPVVGSEAVVPVRRIFCVGRNYEDHAKEMGIAVDRRARDNQPCCRVQGIVFDLSLIHIYVVGSGRWRRGRSVD